MHWLQVPSVNLKCSSTSIGILNLLKHAAEAIVNSSGQLASRPNVLGSSGCQVIALLQIHGACPLKVFFCEDRASQRVVQRVQAALGFHLPFKDWLWGPLVSPTQESGQKKDSNAKLTSEKYTCEF